MDLCVDLHQGKLVDPDSTSATRLNSVFIKRKSCHFAETRIVYAATSSIVTNLNPFILIYSFILIMIVIR